MVFSAVAGNCLDVGGGGYPSSGQVLGRVLSTNGGAGTYQIDLFPADIRSPSITTTFPQVVYNTASASTNANIAATTMVTVGASDTTYRVVFYPQVTVLGASCVGATNLNFNLIFQDPVAAGTVTNTIGFVLAVTNGVLGEAAGYGFGAYTLAFRAKASTAIQYSTTYGIGSSCAPGAQYKIFPILEQLTSN